MKPATRTPAVVVLADTIRRRAEEPGLPTLPLPWLKSRLIKRTRERRVFSIGLVPTSLTELARYRVSIPTWGEARAFNLFLLIHLADVNANLEDTEVEVSPLLLSNHLDATETEIVDVVWDLTSEPHAITGTPDQTPRAYSFRHVEDAQQRRARRLARWRRKRSTGTAASTPAMVE